MSPGVKLSTVDSNLQEQRRRQRRARLHSLSPILFVVPALSFYGMFVVYPVLSALALSFFNWDGISPTRDFVGLHNYMQLFFHDPVFWTSIVNTFKWTALSIVLPTSIALTLAMAINQPLRGRTTIRTLIYVPSVLAPIAVATIWVWMYNPYFGILNATFKLVGLRSLALNWLGDQRVALYSVFVAELWRRAGLYMVIFLAGLQGIPHELLEAARIDGANAWQVFRHITIPCLRQTFIIVATLTTVNALRAFDVVFGMTGGGPAHKTQVLASWSYFKSFNINNYGQGMALSVVLLVCTLAIIVPYLLWTTRED